MLFRSTPVTPKEVITVPEPVVLTPDQVYMAEYKASLQDWLLKKCEYEFKMFTSGRGTGREYTKKLKTSAKKSRRSKKWTTTEQEITVTSSVRQNIMSMCMRVVDRALNPQSRAKSEDSLKFKKNRTMNTPSWGVKAQRGRYVPRASIVQYAQDVSSAMWGFIPELIEKVELREEEIHTCSQKRFSRKNGPKPEYVITYHLSIKSGRKTVYQIGRAHV